MEKPQLKVGDFVRNRISGSFGRIVQVSRRSRQPFIRVLLIKEPLPQYHSYWTPENVELIKHVTK